MKQYDNNMSGVLFRNDKEGNANRADYRGHCEINGQEFWMSAWINTSKDRQKFMSIRFKPKDKAPSKGAPPQAGEDFNDEIPF